MSLLTCLELATYLKVKVVTTRWVFSMQSTNVHPLWKSWPHSGFLASKVSGPGRLQIHYGLVVKHLPYWVSLVAQMMVKNLPGIQETRVQSLDHGDPLEKRMVTWSSILARRILWIEEPGGLHTVRGVTKRWTQLSDQHFHFHVPY